MILMQFHQKEGIFKVSFIIAGYVIPEMDFESRTPIANDNNIQVRTFISFAQGYHPHSPIGE